MSQANSPDWIVHVPGRLRPKAALLADRSPYFARLTQGISKETCAQLFQPLEDALLPEDTSLWLPSLTVRDIQHAQQILRQCKRHGICHFIWWELGLNGDITRSYTALSSWACGLIGKALGMAFSLLEEKYGHIQGGRFSIIGLGKLGGQELNLGSDVDLLFVWQGHGQTQGGRRSIDVDSFYSEIARLFIRLMAERTVDGLVWPVDMRLRPGGDGAPICLNLDSTLNHYLNYGQTWERAMLIKADVVGGDRDLGLELIESLKPFIYRRYLDYSAVAALAEMKQRIDLQAGELAPGKGFDVKRGHGGIREIEFIIQSMQLLHGGRDTSLQRKNGQDALDALVAAGIIENSLSETLTESYQFWRRIEHAVQARNGEQTHRLPADFDGFLNSLLETRAIEKMMKRHTETVGAIFSEEVLPHSNRASNAVNWLTAPWPDELKGICEEKRDAMIKSLTRIDQHLSRGILPERCRHDLESILDFSMPKWIQDTNGESACSALADLIENIEGRATWIDLLATHRGALEWLTGVLSASQYLARFLSEHPHLLEWPLLEARGEVEVQQICGRIDGIQSNQDEAEAIAQLGRWVDLARVQCALMIDAHLTSPNEIGLLLANIADAATRCVFRLSLGQLALDDEFPFVIVAMGKHGSKEMGLCSDLDMVFLLTDLESDQSPGKPTIEAREFAQKLGRRVIRQLTDQSPFGAGYEFDGRLRPSGAGGILVSTLDGFIDYQLHEAQTWEHQALCRARTVAGPAPARRRVEEALKAILARPRDLETVRKDMCVMRQKMLDHLASHDASIINLKQDRGGLVDIEFLAQFARLCFDGNETGTIATLSSIPETAPEAWREVAPGLIATYLAFRDVDNILRVELWQSIQAIPSDPTHPVWISMADHTDFNHPDRLEETMHQTKAVFDQLISEPIQPLADTRIDNQQ